ncbi:hypothetical protein [Ruegeria jejuensis]|uniref:hypothetical protein n=1 Tax=Ruegeria jejuensis TaxID=3233338 RepID=UPI00355C290C
MKIYGYENGDDSGKLLDLSEVSICFESSEEAERFADFAVRCANNMKAMGNGYDHEHLIDFDEKQFPSSKPDIVIARLSEANR